ncbi:MAG: hypothetical protein ACRDTC_28185 [Pseudonocardiaceae bacterium]
MSGKVSFSEIDGQHVELLPARTLLQTGGGTLSGNTVEVAVVNADVRDANVAAAAATAQKG